MLSSSSSGTTTRQLNRNQDTITKRNSQKSNATYILLEGLFWLINICGFVVIILGFLDITKPVDALLVSLSPSINDLYQTYGRPAFIVAACLCVIVATMALIAGLCRAKQCCRIGMLTIYPLLSLLIIGLFGTMYFIYKQKLEPIMKDYLYCGDVETLYSFCASAASTPDDLKRCQYAVPDRFGPCAFLDLSFIYSSAFSCCYSCDASTTG